MEKKNAGKFKEIFQSGKVGTMILWSICQNVFITVRQRSCEKVVFSQVFVIHSVQWEEVLQCDHYP